MAYWTVPLLPGYELLKVRKEHLEKLIGHKARCYAFWCCPCFACSTTSKFGESGCLPLVDILGPGVMAAMGLPICVPPVTLSMRVAVRHKYQISGDICEDIAISCFCILCSWCQMNREIEHRQRFVINVQQMTPMVNAAPVITTAPVATGAPFVTTAQPTAVIVTNP
ncbi:hypothetical protein NFI96_023471 [Prochilodus magdalenae]|nr:hypothetical protein NFI96_023471 [Prochilodus magdalenae]